MSKRGRFTVLNQKGQQIIKTSSSTGLAIALEIEPGATIKLSPPDYNGNVQICSRRTRKGKVLYDVVGSRIIARDLDSHEEAVRILKEVS